MPDKIKLLYDAASKKYDLGTFDEFSNKLQDESKRKAFFNIASNDFDLGDFNSFTNKVKKKSRLTTYFSRFANWWIRFTAWLASFPNY